MPARLGAPAEAWFAVWLRDYAVILDPATDTLAASYTRTGPVRIRPITPADARGSTPGRTDEMRP